MDKDRERLAERPSAAEMLEDRAGDEISMSELARMMLSWEEMKQSLDALGETIKRKVLWIGKTQNVGNVRASFAKGRRVYDYKTPGQFAPEDLIGEHTTTVTTTDWRNVCKDAQIEGRLVKQSLPSVSLKLLE